MAEHQYLFLFFITYKEIVWSHQHTIPLREIIDIGKKVDKDLQ